MYARHSPCTTSLRPICVPRQSPPKYLGFGLKPLAERCGGLSAALPMFWPRSTSRLTTRRTTSSTDPLVSSQLFELSSDKEPHCVMTLKAKAVLVDGVSYVEEDEEVLDPFIRRDCWAELVKLSTVESRVVRRAREEFGVLGFVGLGGFGNVRQVYEWKGLKLEVDETNFGFGTVYETECESDNPEDAKKLLEEFLKDHGIDYLYSNKSKFAIFQSGKLP